MIIRKTKHVVGFMIKHGHIRAAILGKGKYEIAMEHNTARKYKGTPKQTMKYKTKN